MPSAWSASTRAATARPGVGDDARRHRAPRGRDGCARGRAPPPRGAPRPRRVRDLEDPRRRGLAGAAEGARARDREREAEISNTEDVVESQRKRLDRREKRFAETEASLRDRLLDLDGRENELARPRKRASRPTSRSARTSSNAASASWPTSRSGGPEGERAGRVRRPGPDGAEAPRGRLVGEGHRRRSAQPLTAGRRGIVPGGRVPGSDLALQQHVPGGQVPGSDLALQSRAWSSGRSSTRALSRPHPPADRRVVQLEVRSDLT